MSVRGRTHSTGPASGSALLLGASVALTAGVLLWDWRTADALLLHWLPDELLLLLEPLPLWLVEVAAVLTGGALVTRTAAVVSHRRWTLLGRSVVAGNGLAAVRVVMGSAAPAEVGWAATATVLVALALTTATAWHVVGPCGTRPWAPWALLAAAGTLGLAWVTVTNAGIDVYLFQEQAAQRLLEGRNPYLPGYRDPYRRGYSALIYGEGLSVDGVLQFGFPYPPLSLLLSTGGYLLGELRLAHLAALLVAGGLALTMVPASQTARVGGAALLTSPILLLVLQRSWTEPFLVLGLAAVAWAHRRDVPWRDVALGLLLAVKQYAILFLPVVLLVLDHGRPARQRWRTTVRAGLVAVAVTAPLAVWDLGEFVFSVGLLQFQQPFRADSLSLLALSVNTTGWPPERWHVMATGLGALVALGFVVRRAPASLCGYAAGAALVQLGFLLLSKQAFTNYYFLALAALLLAIAATDTDTDTDTEG